MSLKLDELSALPEVLKALHPDVSVVVKMATELYGPLLKDLSVGLVESFAEIEVAHINKLKSLGLSHEDALLLCLDLKTSMANGANRARSNK